MSIHGVIPQQSSDKGQRNLLLKTIQPFGYSCDFIRIELQQKSMKKYKKIAGTQVSTSSDCSSRNVEKDYLRESPVFHSPVLITKEFFQYIQSYYKSVFSLEFWERVSSAFLAFPHRNQYFSQNQKTPRVLAGRQSLRRIF